MRPIHLCKNLFHDGYELRYKSSKGSVVFARQGDLDSACAVYSLMMLLILHGKVKYNDLVRKHTKKGYTSIKRLQNSLLAELPGLYKEGYSFSDLRDILNSSFKKVTQVESISIGIGDNVLEKKKVIQKCLMNQLERGMAVEIGYTHKGGKSGHAVLAIGFQDMDGSLVRLFCLDPSHDIQPAMYWNTIIDMTKFDNNDEKDKKDKKYNARITYSDISYSEINPITIDEVLYNVE